VGEVFKEVLRSTLEKQKENELRLLFTKDEIEQEVSNFTGETLDDVEWAAHNAIVRHRNVLCFTAAGIKRAKEAYKDEEPFWWKQDRVLAEIIETARKRVKENK
jgi:hypothetical protein